LQLVCKNDCRSSTFAIIHGERTLGDNSYRQQRNHKNQLLQQILQHLKGYRERIQLVRDCCHSLDELGQNVLPPAAFAKQARTHLGCSDNYPP